MTTSNQKPEQKQPLPEAVVVPRELYYHEVAYVRGLEAEVERLRALLRHYEDGAEARRECQEYGKEYGKP